MDVTANVRVDTAPIMDIVSNAARARELSLSVSDSLHTKPVPTQHSWIAAS